jgi:D-threonate/D-erythronate kinase
VRSAFPRSEDLATPICHRASRFSMPRQMRICGGSLPLVGDAPVPFCGLAQALTAGYSRPALLPLPGPILGLFGSDQPVTAGQLAACEPHWLHIEGHAFDPIPRRLDAAGLALVSFHLPPGTPRGSAAARIAIAITRLIDRVGPPGTVVVAGGETLRSLCDAVDS